MACVIYQVMMLCIKLIIIIKTCIKLHGKHAFSKCEHIIELIFSFQNLILNNIFETLMTKIIQNSISHPPP